MNLDQYREVVLVDFEYIPRDGEALNYVVCVVAHLLKAGRTLRVLRDDFGAEPPYPTGSDTLFVSFNAVAELGCHLALGWPMPKRVLDLYVEYLAHTNAFRPKGTKPPEAKLIAALLHFGLDTIGAPEKREMIELILRGRPWTEQERAAILDYCESDVEALRRLLPALLPHIDVPRATLRGRYMAAVAHMERNGIPIDGESLARLRQHWPAVQAQLIADDDKFGVYVNGSFSGTKFAQLLTDLDIAWPCYPDGTPDLRKETFRDMAETAGASMIAPICRLRNALSGTRLGIGLLVGHDNRNRTTLFPFRSTTGRNQPSNARFIFGCARWMRGLIKPPPGWAVSYLDYEQQEFGIAAALSGDTSMLEAYMSGDPYLAFAKQAGLVPPPWEREPAEFADRSLACIRVCQMGKVWDFLVPRNLELGPLGGAVPRAGASAAWRNWTLGRDADGIDWLVLDRPGASANLLTFDVLSELDDVLGASRARSAERPCAAVRQTLGLHRRRRHQRVHRPDRRHHGGRTPARGARGGRPARSPTNANGRRHPRLRPRRGA